jgi:hypothetical protein
MIMKNGDSKEPFEGRRHSAWVDGNSFRHSRHLDKR